LPETYRIDMSRKNKEFVSETGDQGTQIVHWSRTIHIAEDLLEDDVYGRPILLRVLNTVFNDTKVEAASAEAFWQLADKILVASIDAQAQLQQGDIDALSAQLAEIMHDLRRQISLKGGNLDWVGGDTPDPTGLAELIGTKLGAGAGIPKRILYGSERGELASSQDERNYLGTVQDRQTQHAGPNIVRALIDRLIEFGAVRPPGREGYEVQWANPHEPTEQEVAERNKAAADTAKALTPVGGDPLELVEIDDDRNVWLRPSAEIWEERQAMGAPARGEAPEPMDEPPEPTDDDSEEEAEDT
jgi:hypothetical protein